MYLINKNFVVSGKRLLLSFFPYASHVSFKKIDHVIEYEDHTVYLVIKLIPIEVLHSLSTGILRRKSPGLFTKVQLVVNWGNRNMQYFVLQIMKTQVWLASRRNFIPIFSIYHLSPSLLY